MAEHALRMGVHWMAHWDRWGWYLCLGRAKAWSGHMLGQVSTGTALQRILFLVLLHWGKFAADSLHWCSHFGGCFCSGLVCLRPVCWCSSFNYSFCLVRTTLSSSLTARALNWLSGPWPRNGWMWATWQRRSCVLVLSFLFCHVFLTDLHADLQRLCAVSCDAHSMNWIIKRFLFHHFCSAFSRNIHLMCCDCFRCACVEYLSEIPLCIFNTCSLPFFFLFISRIPLRATIVPKASWPQTGCR